MGDTEHGTWTSAELGAYIERCKVVGVDVGNKPDKTVICDADYNVIEVRNAAHCRICGAPTKFYEQPDLCLKCETEKR